MQTATTIHKLRIPHERRSYAGYHTYAQKLRDIKMNDSEITTRNLHESQKLPFFNSSTTWSSTPAPTMDGEDENFPLYPLGLVIPITIVYIAIFLVGVGGNVSTCIVIAWNKSMHTATNYYLFSLAISDMLLLISALPPEMYRIWSPEVYVFGHVVCILQGFAAETSANATVLTITAFTVERYFAICHPFLFHKISKLSRAVRFIVGIWIVALCLAAPQAMQFGVEYENKNGTQYSRCTVVSDSLGHAFEISTFLFFVGPMSLITVLYILIGIQLRKSRNIIRICRRPSLSNGGGNAATANEIGGYSKTVAAQNRVIKMLIAVVVAFFICWAPFHAQRLLAVYLANATKEDQDTALPVYIVLMYMSGILYYLSTTINPVLYHIMSHKFRDAFKKTFFPNCWLQNKARDSKFVMLKKWPEPVRASNRSSSGNRDHENPSNFRGKPRSTTAVVEISNAISNSSLLDMDEIDYNSSDLIKHMRNMKGKNTGN